MRWEYDWANAYRWHIEPVWFSRKGSVHGQAPQRGLDALEAFAGRSLWCLWTTDAGWLPLEEALDAYGAMGWELVSMGPATSHFDTDTSLKHTLMFVFKRPVP